MAVNEYWTCKCGSPKHSPKMVFHCPEKPSYEALEQYLMWSLQALSKVENCLKDMDSQFYGKDLSAAAVAKCMTIASLTIDKITQRKK